MSDTRVAVIIVSYNTCDLTLQAVSSVLSCDGVLPEVWVVDNASTDDTVGRLGASFPEVNVIAMEENVGFGRANNEALRVVQTPFILLLNSDAYFAQTHGLHRLVQLLEQRPETGVVGPRLESPEGGLQYSARAFPRIIPLFIRSTGLHRFVPKGMREGLLALEFRDHSRAGSVDWLTGACLLTRREVWSTVGRFDPNIFMYGEELDWCWRVRQAGWDIRLEPEVLVRHHRGASGLRGDAWRVASAMAGDAYVVRKHRGMGYLLLYGIARAAAWSLEGLVQGAVGLFTGNAERVTRARGTWSLLWMWVGTFWRGGKSPSGDPGLGPPDSADRSRAS